MLIFTEGKVPGERKRFQKSGREVKTDEECSQGAGGDDVKGTSVGRSGGKEE